MVRNIFLKWVLIVGTILPTSMAFSIENRKTLTEKIPTYIQLLSALGYGNEKRFMSILRNSSININSFSVNKRSLIHLAILVRSMVGHSTIENSLQILIDAGADINSKGYAGSAPLHTALYSASVDAALFLIDAGADVNAVDDFGNTPGHIAAQFNQLKVVKKLLSKGATINILNSQKGSPLHISVFFNYKEMSQLLLDNQASVDLKNIGGKTAYDIALDNSNLELTSLIDKYRNNDFCKNNFKKQNF